MAKPVVSQHIDVDCDQPPASSLEFDGHTVLCRVCGDRASGFHYGVHACEGCKGFFRRSIQQKIHYRACLKNQMCVISRINRNRCQYCRLKKCIGVGMSRDAVRFGRVPKREKAKILEQMQRVCVESQNSLLDHIITDETQMRRQIIDVHMRTCLFTSERFEAFYRHAWANPVFVQCSANMACPLNPAVKSDDDLSQRWTSQLTNCFVPAIRCVIDFARSIPGFRQLHGDDQVTLLKAGTFEVMLVHLSRLFDSNTNTMLFVDGKILRRPPTASSACGFLLNSMFDFSERFNELRLTDEEIALFSALVVISADRPGLRGLDAVERLQSAISRCLQNVMITSRPSDPSIFTRLVVKMSDLRTLNTIHSEKLLGGTVGDVLPSGTGGMAMNTESKVKDDSSIYVKTELAMDSVDLSTASPTSSLQRHDISSTFCTSHDRLRTGHRQLVTCPPQHHVVLSDDVTHSSGAVVVGRQEIMSRDESRELILSTPFGSFHRTAPSFWGSSLPCPRPPAGHRPWTPVDSVAVAVVSDCVDSSRDSTSSVSICDTHSHSSPCSRLVASSGVPDSPPTNQRPATGHVINYSIDDLTRKSDETSRDFSSLKARLLHRADSDMMSHVSCVPVTSSSADVTTPLMYHQAALLYNQLTAMRQLHQHRLLLDTCIPPRVPTDCFQSCDPLSTNDIGSP